MGRWDERGKGYRAIKLGIASAYPVLNVMAYSAINTVQPRDRRRDENDDSN